MAAADRVGFGNIGGAVPLSEAQEGAMALGFGPVNAERAQQISDAVGRLITPEDLQMNLQPPGTGVSTTGGKRPTLGEVLGYAQTYPALANQIRELGSLVSSGLMSSDDAQQALLNSARATSTLRSDYAQPLQTTASMSAWDGVDRKAQAQASLNKNLSEAILLPVAAAIPVLQGTRLAAYGLGTVYSTVGPWGTAGLGAATSGGMDAAMQYYDTGTVRPAQTLFSATVGGVSGPLGATSGLFTNIVLGGSGAALNTQFQNSYYGDDKNLGVPVLVGSTFGLLGYQAGAYTTQGLSLFRPERYFVNLNPQVPALFQPIVVNQVPQFFGVTTGGITSGLSPLGESAITNIFNPTPKKP